MHVCVIGPARAHACTHERQERGGLKGERKDSFPDYCASELPPLSDKMLRDLDNPVEKFLTHHPPRVCGQVSPVGVEPTPGTIVWKAEGETWVQTNILFIELHRNPLEK